ASERPCVRVARAWRDRRRPCRRARAVPRWCTRRTSRRRRGLPTRTRLEPVAEPALVLDQVLRAERLELLAQLPDELRELLAGMHRFPGPHRPHELVVGTENGRAAGRRVSLDHVTHEAMCLRTNRELVLIAPRDEHEPRGVRVVAEAVADRVERDR